MARDITREEDATDLGSHCGIPTLSEHRQPMEPDQTQQTGATVGSSSEQVISAETGADLDHLSMNLYLQKCFPYLRQPFVYLPRLHAQPFTWLHHSNVPVRNTNRRDLAHWWLNTSLFFIHFTFVVCRTVQVLKNPDESLLQKFYVTGCLQIYVISAIITVTTVRTREEFVSFCRRYIDFLQNGKH